MKAMLVMTSFVTRVIVEDNATEDNIIFHATNKIVDQVLNEFDENIEEICSDLEQPYNPEIE